MDDKVFIEENSEYQFDFSSAQWATDEIHNIFHQDGQIFCDADFACEFLAATESEKIRLLVVEYKNANIQKALANRNKTEAFDPLKDKKVNNVARKYLDTMSYLLVTRPRGAEKRYVYVLEAPNSDIVTRGMVREKIMKFLPFKLQKSLQVEEKLIDSFEVLSIDEWNKHPIYSKFPISRINA